jgi:hypothetical protein
MTFHAPPDLGWYDVLRDFGGLIGAAVALLAAATGYAAVRLQIVEMQRENRDRRDAETRATAERRLIAVTLVSAALEALRYDLDRVSNTIGRGAGEGIRIEPDRMKWLSQRVHALSLEPVLKVAEYLHPACVKEYIDLTTISHRLLENDGTLTYGALRDQIETVRNRVTDLQKLLNDDAELARAALG